MPNKFMNQSPKQKIKKARLVVILFAATAAFVVLRSVWFYVMGTFSVIGAVWVIREYKKDDDQ